MATITLEYHGVEASGRTVKEAKQAAGEKIRKALDGSYAPEVLVWRGWVTLLFRDPQGWCYRLIMDPQRGVIEGPVHAAPNDETAKDARESAYYGMVQGSWVPADGTDPPAVLTSRVYQSEYRSWTKFQLRYRWAREHGLTDHEAHSWAGKNPSTPDLMSRIPPYPGDG